MPLFYQHDINRLTKLGVWRIEEPELHFLAKVSLNRNVSHPHKRLQHLAGRYLLSELFADFPLEEILIADTNKPFLENEQYHFSISHCGDFAAAIVSRTQRVGIDIEKMDPRIERIHHKFLSPAEFDLALEGWPATGFSATSHQSIQSAVLTALWCAKESLFKWYGLGQVDFKRHMELRGPVTQGEDGLLDLPFSFKKNGLVQIGVQLKILQDLAIAWIAH
jgi:4'-phosphopantetheinyl transferase EntD